jgi:hypothetical protein
VNLRLHFERPRPDDYWGNLIVAATQPGNECHVEVETELGFFSSRPGEGVSFLPALDQTRTWDVMETPWYVSEAAMVMAQTWVGQQWCYDWIGAAESAIGRAQHVDGRAFCSGACFEFARLCGLLLYPTLPDPNRLYWLVQAATGKRMGVMPSATQAPADIADLFKEACRREYAQGGPG